MLGTLVIAAAALATGVSEADKAAAARSAAVAALGPTVTWTKRTSAGKKSWLSITSDATGLRLAAGEYNGGRIHTSTNGGESWTEQQGSMNIGLQFLDSSDDGSRLVGFRSGSRSINSAIFKSGNGGVSWQEMKQGFYRGATCDRACHTIVTTQFKEPPPPPPPGGGGGAERNRRAITSDGPIISVDGGIAWQDASLDDKPNQFTVMSKDTGPNKRPVAMIGIHAATPNADISNGDTVMVKRGSGAWTIALNLNTDEAQSFFLPAVNADGRVMLVSADGLPGKAGVFYVSTNRGGSWTKHAIVPEGGVGAGETVRSRVFASSHSGKTLAGVYYVKLADGEARNSGVLVSLDGGVSWAKQPLAVPDDESFSNVAVSGDGTRIVVAANRGYIYTGVVNPLPGPAGWLAWEYQTAMGVALGATAAGVPIGAAALREK